MVVLRGLINGQQRIIVENIVLGQLGVVQVHREGYLANVQGSPLTLDMEDSEALRQRIAAVPGVAGVSPRLSFGGMLSMPEPEGAAESEPRTTFLNEVGGRGSLSLRGGRAGADAERGPGAQPAAPGDGCEDGATSGAVAGASGEGVRLSGTLVSAAPGDRREGYLPLATAQRLLRMEGRVTEYAVAGCARAEGARSWS